MPRGRRKWPVFTLRWWGKVLYISAILFTVATYTVIRVMKWEGGVRRTSPPHWSTLFQKPHGLDCPAYLEGDRTRTDEALERQSGFNRTPVSDEKFLDITRNCEEFRRYRGYKEQVIPYDRDFPIAYSILLYKEAEQAERLLRAVYAPHNLYCIHVDGKSPRALHRAMSAIANCFPNVFIVSRTETVVYSGYSRLKADLNCMQDLINTNSTWKYFINLPSQSFPLKTNSEIVKILRIYNGSNDIEGLTGHRMMSWRIKSVFLPQLDKNNGNIHMVQTNRKKSPPPHNITVVKGSAYGVFSRDFVQFIMTNPRVQDFLEWSKDVLSPDEYVWATLNHLPKTGELHAPGGYTGAPDKKPWLATYAAWRGVDQCHGFWQRGVCVFGLGDIPMLISRKELFANKFDISYHPFALYCMEEWLHNKSLSAVPSDLYYYRQLPFIHH